MADILNLSFGCGNTLLASQLNQIVEAINRIYNNQSESNEDYIPISGSDDISGNLIPDGSDNYNLGDKSNYWKDIYTSTEHAKILKFHSQQLTYESLGELYVGKDTSNNNETILHFKHGNNNEEIVATRDWVNSLLNPTRINIGSAGLISEELYNDESDYIKIESSSNNPIVITGYDEEALPSGIKFGDASTGDVLTVHGGKIYINGDIFGGENGVSVLNDLSNVSVAAPGTGDFLMYNGTRWVSNPLPESLIKHPGNVSINEEYYLKYEKDDEHPSGWYSWVERPSGAKKLNELNDVEINDIKLELGQVLVYSQVTDEENNTYNSWVNKTLSGSLTYNQSDHNKYLKVNSNGNGTEWSDISLSDLSNTEIGGSNNALSNGLVLVYDSSLSKWKNTSLPANLPSVSGHGNEYLKVKNDGTGTEWTSVIPGSGLTGIKYQTTGNATEITPSSGYVTLKAGNNVSFTSSTGSSVLEISATGGGGGVTNVKINDLSVVTNNIANIPLASSSAFGVVKIGVYGGLTLDNDGFLKLNATNIGQNKTGLFLVTDAGSTLSYSWVEIDLSNPANGNALIYDNGVWTCGNIIPTKNSNTNGYLKSTAGVLSWSPGSYTLLPADDNTLGGIKTGYTNNNKNYKVLVDNNGNAYVNVPWTASNLTLSGLIGSSSIGGQTTPIYWTGSAFSTCSIQNSGSSNRTLENSTTRNNLKSALLQDKSICVMFDNVGGDNNVTSLDYVRISELRYKAKKSLQSSFFFYKGTIDATNNIINPVFYVDLKYNIFLTKVTNTTNDYARIKPYNSNDSTIDTYSTWTSTAETVVKNLLLNKYGISCDFSSTSVTSGAYSIGTTNRLVQKTVNFYIEED